MNRRCTFRGADIISKGKICLPRRSVEVLSEEPMVFGAIPSFAYQHGGFLTRLVLNSLDLREPLDDMPEYSWKIDTRVQMLMAGMYPAIPGWHCDGVPRPNGQPEVALADPDEVNVALTVSDDQSETPVSQTEFINAPTSLFFDPNQVWRSVNANMDENELVCQVPDGHEVVFGSLALHRATPAQRNGWRFWIRATFSKRPPMNKIRRQVNVYTPIGIGW